MSSRRSLEHYQFQKFSATRAGLRQIPNSFPREIKISPTGLSLALTRNKVNKR